MIKKRKELLTTGTIARNKKAGFNYFLEEKLEAGLELFGSEVKSLRLGKASITEAYVAVTDDHLELVNATIEEYPGATVFQHKPTRPRRLLMHKKEMKKFIGGVKRKGYTIIPVSLYFNARGIAKVEIALATGKKLFDKRETQKQRDWNREKSRLMKRG